MSIFVSAGIEEAKRTKADDEVEHSTHMSKFILELGNPAPRQSHRPRRSGDIG